jgi:glycerol-3-phosphate acyltransferase PlsY
MPVMGLFQNMQPTAEMYNNPEAFAFIQMMMNSGYLNYAILIVFLVSVVCLWTGRVALASLLILPVTVNIVAFHAFLDGGLLVPGAIMGNILLLLNVYFLWQSRRKIEILFKK